MGQEVTDLPTAGKFNKKCDPELQEILLHLDVQTKYGRSNKQLTVRT